MKVLNERPPEWIMQGCLNQFRVNVERTFWTYGDVLYNPGGIDVRPDIMAHEEQHERQQKYESLLPYLEPADRIDDEALPGKLVDAWWKRYLAEPRFRLEQEAEAYGVQYKWFCKQVADRNRRAKFLHMLAEQLSGPLYQIAVTHLQARTMIEVLAGKKQLPKNI